MNGYLSKLTYIMRKIPDIKHHLKEIDTIILTEFLPSLFGGRNISEFDRKIISLPVKFGGLGIPILADICEQEYENSKFATENLVSFIIEQDQAWSYSNENSKHRRKKIRSENVSSARKMENTTRGNV